MTLNYKHTHTNTAKLSPQQETTVSRQSAHLIRVLRNKIPNILQDELRSQSTSYTSQPTGHTRNCHVTLCRHRPGDRDKPMYRLPHPEVNQHTMIFPEHHQCVSQDRPSREWRVFVASGANPTRPGTIYGENRYICLMYICTYRAPELNITIIRGDGNAQNAQQGIKKPTLSGAFERAPGPPPTGRRYDPL